MKLKIFQPQVENLKDRKEFLLNNSKTFCMYPWISLHINPVGQSFPCCISNPNIDFGTTENSSISELINHPRMKGLRLDMVNEIPNIACSICYNHESNNISSARLSVNKEYEKNFDEVVVNTKEDGHLDDFKMRYFDVRFSNLCNFKCRTCGPGFSSQWETELVKNNMLGPILYKNDNPQVLDEVLNHIPYIETAYFAGGEPLINENHYIILEEMLLRNRNDIKLVYNSNISNLKFKDKDLLGLWNKFKHPIEMYASIDHYGEKAEYIRHGTDWGVIETNIVKIKNLSNVNFSINTVFSVFNALSITDFYFYLYSKGWLTNNLSLYPMTTPEALTSTVLPKNKKIEAVESMESFSNRLSIIKKQEFNFHNPRSFLNQMKNAATIMNSKNDWDVLKDEFRAKIKTIDNIRGESFIKVFPELADMLDD